MKRSTALLLLLGVCSVVALVIYATISLAGGHNSLSMLLMVQQQTPALWALDGAAAYAVLLTMLYSSQARRTETGQTRRTETRQAQVESLQVEHQAQLESMLTNMAKVDEANAALEDRLTAQAESLVARDTLIVAQEETIRSLSAQVASLQQEVAVLRARVDARQERAPEVAMPASPTPVPDASPSVPDEPRFPTPVTQNAPNTVIMEPIYLQLVPVEDAEQEVEEQEVEEQEVDEQEVDEQEDDEQEIVKAFSEETRQKDEIKGIEVLPEAETPAEVATESALISVAPSPVPERAMLDEPHALVVPEPELQVPPDVAESLSSDGNFPFPLSRPALRITRWQRKL